METHGLRKQEIRGGGKEDEGNGDGAQTEIGERLWSTTGQKAGKSDRERAQVRSRKEGDEREGAVAFRIGKEMAGGEGRMDHESMMHARGADMQGVSRVSYSRLCSVSFPAPVGPLRHPLSVSRLGRECSGRA